MRALDYSGPVPLTLPPPFPPPSFPLTLSSFSVSHWSPSHPFSHHSPAVGGSISIAWLSPADCSVTERGPYVVNNVMLCMPRWTQDVVRRQCNIQDISKYGSIYRPAYAWFVDRR